jgi:hypothetical protein
MDLNIIKRICGPIPDGFVKVNPNNSTYVFTADPNFNPINLYDFFGRAATVNSFTECFYYVELGFEPDKITVFDILIPILQIFIGILVTYFLIKKGLIRKSLIYLKDKIWNFKNLSFKTKNRMINFISILLFFTQLFYLYDYVRTKSLRIPSFIDEYITLTSNVNFFKYLNFNAGNFIGGNYSVEITSGIISSLGGVVGWITTENFIISRMTNFLWVYILQVIFIVFITKIFNLEKNFLILFSGFSIILFPWWQGALYSIGEIPSSILFVNAAILFYRFRKLSLVLFCFSIFYGKILNLVLFGGFYFFIIVKEKNIKNILGDFKIFLLTYTPWLLLVNLKYSKGNVIDYLYDQFYFITNHQSSGVTSESVSIFQNYLINLNLSEYSSWNSYDKSRLIFIPILFIYVVFKNKEKINEKFGAVSLPLISSILFIYLWFWFLNTTKWMRHTQHFIVPIVVFSAYLISSDLIKNKLDIVVLYSLIGILIENNKLLIWLLIFLIIFTTNFSKYNLSRVILIFVLIIDIASPFHEKEKSGNIDILIPECKEELTSSECRTAYLSN